MMMFLGRISSASSAASFLPAHAVAQGDGHGALGVLLAYHILVKFGHDLPRRKFVKHSRPFRDFSK